MEIDCTIANACEKRERETSSSRRMTNLLNTTGGNTTKQSATLLTNKFLKVGGARWTFSVGGSHESSTKRADRR